MRRSHLLEDATNRFMKLQSSDFRKIFRFSFEGEPALDAGGVAREWYEEITKTLFDLNFGLFCGSSDNQALYQINRNSGIANTDHLTYFRFAGRLMAKALLDGQLIKPHLVRPFYKHIIGAHRFGCASNTGPVQTLVASPYAGVPIRLGDSQYINREMHNRYRIGRVGGLIAACLHWHMGTAQGEFVMAHTAHALAIAAGSRCWRWKTRMSFAWILRPPMKFSGRPRSPS